MAIFYGDSPIAMFDTAPQQPPRTIPEICFICFWVPQKPSTYVYWVSQMMCIYVFFLIIDDYFWLLMIFFDYLWLFMIIYGYFWLFMIMLDIFLPFLIIYVCFWIIFDYFWLLLATFDYLCLFMCLKWFFMIVCDYSWLFVWLFMIVWCWFTIIDPKAWRFSWGKPALRSFFQAWHRRSCGVSLGRSVVVWRGRDWAAAKQKIPVDS